MHQCALIRCAIVNFVLCATELGIFTLCECNLWTLQTFVTYCLLCTSNHYLNRNIYDAIRVQLTSNEKQEINPGLCDIFSEYNHTSWGFVLWKFAWTWWRSPSSHFLKAYIILFGIRLQLIQTLIRIYECALHISGTHLHQHDRITAMDTREIQSSVFVCSGRHGSVVDWIMHCIYPAYH